MVVETRRAQVTDAAVVALLGRLTFRETFGHLFKSHDGDLAAYLDRTFAAAKIASSIKKPENRFWLTSLNGLPVGYAKQKCPSPNALIDDPAPAQLQKIYVLAEFVGHRIGSALMAEVMSAAAKAGIKLMWLTVLDTNARAIRFYEHSGWTDAGSMEFNIGAQCFSFRVFKTGISNDRKKVRTAGKPSAPQFTRTTG